MQTDLFARSLRSKLMSLSPTQLEYEKENARGIGGISVATTCASGISTSDDMMLLHVNNKSFHGMSYPPPNHMLALESGSLGSLAVEMKFRSEPDLSHPKTINGEDSLRMCINNLVSISEANTKNRTRLESCDDSDLFFDFDIEDDSRRDKSNNSHGPNNNDNTNKTIENCIDDLLCSNNKIGHQTPVTPEFSTAYGSVRSSTPGSDEESEVRENVNNSQKVLMPSEGVSLFPDDWKQHLAESSNKNSNTSDHMSNTFDKLTMEGLIAENNPTDRLTQNINSEENTIDNPKVYNDFKCPEIHHESPSNDITELPDKPPSSFPKLFVSGDESSDDEDFKEGMSIKVGSAETKIANNKLLTLISLLEKDRDYSRNKKSETNNRSKTNKKHPTIRSVPSHESSFALGASPVNFSFLRRGSKDVLENSPLSKTQAFDTTTSDSNKQEESVSESAAGLKRCESLPSLQKIDVQIDIAIQETANNTVNRTEGNDSDDNKDKVEDERKDKYRRCSSLKSGKTPPGSPGKRKIVR